MSSSNSEQNRKRSARFNLIAIGLIAVAPLIGSYALYFLWKPDKFVNYGELFGPVATSAADAPPEVARLRGKWLFMMSDSGACDDWCTRKLYIMRQVRLTQGKDQERIERVWLLEDGQTPSPQLVREYDGTTIVPAQGSALLAKLTKGTPARDHLFVVDPLGNVMMRYPRDADPNRIKKDIGRLLRASRIG